MEKFVCKHCGSDDVEIRVWMNPNTGQCGTDCEDNGECYCNNCNDYSKLDLVKC